MSNLFADLQAESQQQKQHLESQTSNQLRQSSTRQVASKSTQPRDKSREKSRDKSRANPRKITRDKSRDLPTRDEIQEFSFRLRDEVKTKVQAEVPHQWNKELDDLARSLDVKKLELYRFIIGEFLGKVSRRAGVHYD